MKAALVLLLSLGLYGCVEPLVPQYDKELRNKIFMECLEKIPNGPTVTKYNDWAEVIEACEAAAQRQSFIGHGPRNILDR